MLTACEQSIPAKVGTGTGQVWVKAAASPLVVGNDTVWGAYNPRTRTILIDTSLPWEAERHYLRHERCHAALSDDEVALDSLTEEKVCEAIAKGFNDEYRR